VLRDGPPGAYGGGGLDDKAEFHVEFMKFEWTRVCAASSLFWNRADGGTARSAEAGTVADRCRVGAVCGADPAAAIKKDIIHDAVGTQVPFQVSDPARLGLPSLLARSGIIGAARASRYLQHSYPIPMQWMPRIRCRSSDPSKARLHRDCPTLCTHPIPALRDSRGPR
jgi:hypothetical protein